MALVEQSIERYAHPLDVIEQIAARQDWPFTRSADDEINLSVCGKCADYQVCFNWRDDLEGLDLACTFDVKIPALRISEVCRLAARVNEHLWLGHFDVWADEGVLLFRYGLLLAGGTEPTAAQCEGMMRCALDAWERYFPSFQYVIWAGKTANEAIEGAMFETMGEA
ncbi:MAG: hypothetical protein HKN60_07090 [Rhizobiales bacterium]|nr:hypothetical protein [Hyphomicrobiales bacterium]